jgi:DNA-binding MarR family transcriptional regulator
VNPPQLENTGDLLLAAARGLRRRYVDLTAPYDLSPGKARALRVIRHQPGLRLSAVADALGIVPRSATEVVDALESRGLVLRSVDPEDRRAVVVAITPGGIALDDTLDEARRRLAADYVAVLPVPERAELDRLLRRLLEATGD